MSKALSAGINYGLVMILIVLMSIFLYSNIQQNREISTRSRVYSTFNACAIAQSSVHDRPLTGAELDYCWNRAESSQTTRVDRFYGIKLE